MGRFLSRDMKMLSVISPKKKDEPLLPILESQENVEDSVAKEPTEKAKKSGLKVNKKTKQKKLTDSIMDGLASLFYVIPFLILWLTPGIMLGFSGGSYYQYQRMAPYVRQEYNLINRNWRLATELKKVDSILSGMSNLQLFKESGEVVNWEYSLMQGSVMCSYIPTPSEDTGIINQEKDAKQETEHEEWEELEELKERNVV